MWLYDKTFKFLSPENGVHPIALPYQDDTQNSDHNHYINDVTIEVTAGVQYIGFKLHTEEFLLPMAFVREIVMLSTVTFVPQAHVLVEGIIALRGEIMPVLNVRRFLKFEKGKAETTTRVIILHCEFGGYGVIVDDITEFVWLQKHEIETIPQNFFPPEYRILNGVSRIGNKIRGIIDLDKIVSEMASGLQEEKEDLEDAPSDH